jgi:hypothetical protein
MCFRAVVPAVFLALLGGGCDTKSLSSQQEALSLDAPCEPKSLQGCTAGYATTSVTVRLGPDVVALKPFPVTLSVAGDDEKPKTVMVKFVMSGMSMGLNEYRLLPVSDDVWKADVILPICTSGRSDWVAEFTLESPNGRRSLVVPFVLSPPGK